MHSTGPSFTRIPLLTKQLFEARKGLIEVPAAPGSIRTKSFFEQKKIGQIELPMGQFLKLKLTMTFLKFIPS